MNIKQFITRSRRAAPSGDQEAKAERLATARANADQPQQKPALARIARHLGVASEGLPLD